MPRTVAPVAGTLSALDVELWESLRALTRGLFRHLQQDLREVGLTVPQYWVLGCLGSHGRVTAGQLSRWLDVTLPTVSGITEHLVTLGYVARRPLPRDRRQIELRLTARGAKVLAALLEHQRTLARELADLVEDRDKATVARALRRISERLTPDHGPCPHCRGPASA